MSIYQVLQFVLERIRRGGEIFVVLSIEIVIDLLHFFQKLLASIHFLKLYNVINPHGNMGILYSPDINY